MSKPLVSFLVLDYRKPKETAKCLECIKYYAKFPHKVIYLDNGSQESYPWDFHYCKSWTDICILKQHGDGGGHGQTDLFRYCDTEYAIFVQSDQILAKQMDQKFIDSCIYILNNGFHCIDLNGDQSGKGIWTDRAHMIKTKFFNDLGPFPNGGPGLDGIPWNEEYLQNQFKDNNYQIFHAPQMFIDNGLTSIRQSEHGGIFSHETDTKKLTVIKTPTKSNDVYPKLTPEEWDLVLNKKWVNGTIPELSKPHSFVVKDWHY